MYCKLATKTRNTGNGDEVWLEYHVSNERQHVHDMVSLCRGVRISAENKDTVLASPEKVAELAIDVIQDIVDFSMKPVK